MTRAKLLVTICQIEWSRSLEYAQDMGFARTNLPTRARWLAKADAAFWQPSGLEPSWRGFFYVH